MATKKELKGNQINILVIGLLVGGILTWGYLTQIAPQPKQEKPTEKPLTSDMARVNSSDGLKLFIECEPADESKCEKLGTVNVESYIQQMDASNKNKSGFEGAISMFLTTYKNLNYGEKLKLIIDATHDQYKTADGIIITGKMTTAQAIKFKQ